MLDAIDTACEEQSFYYRRCCRVHKLVPYIPVGRCRLCREVPRVLATAEEHQAQGPPPPLL